MGITLATESDLHIELMNTYEEDSDRKSWEAIEAQDPRFRRRET